ncbi:MAG TPA: hypothetical protein VHB20_07170 [Verrucomicrobiae bacterium]|jgi:hypothetical protein|nr:hypothetical protein [Verrucomicrobiae bacterium]
MNQKLSTRAVSRLLCLGALVCSAAAVSAADSKISFQVDMSTAAANGFVLGTDPVSVHGTFNNWGAGVALTNDPNGSNPNLFTGVYDDTLEANGSVTHFKYVYTHNGSDNYENPTSGQPRCFLLPVNSGDTLVTPLAYYNDAANDILVTVNFQVDMSEQVNLGLFDTNTGVVEIHGSFNSWGAAPLALNSPNSDIYSGDVQMYASPGAAEEYKVVANGNYENPTSADGDNNNNNNRFFAAVDQTLPPVNFSDVPFSTITVTNTVTFQIDMGVQEVVGAFNPSSNQVVIHGDLDGWGSGITMTNDPNSANTNIYSAVHTYTGGPGTLENYKYVIEPGTQWENVSTPSGNRQFALPHTNGNFTIGPDFFSFQGSNTISDFLAATTLVTFTVNMTNAVGVGDGTVFDPNANQVFLNGLNNGNENSFWAWGPGNGPSQFLMTEIGSSLLYTVTVPVNRGQSLDLVYKYSIDGFDDEAGFGDNHNRYVRSLGTYTMPVDKFGAQGSSSLSEPSFSGPTVVKNGNNISISWLGRPGAHLQTTSSLTAPVVWTPDLNTDGANLIVAPGGIATTNMPIGSGDKFFQVVKP